MPITFHSPFEAYLIRAEKRNQQIAANPEFYKQVQRYADEKLAKQSFYGIDRTFASPLYGSYIANPHQLQQINYNCPAPKTITLPNVSGRFCVICGQNVCSHGDNWYHFGNANDCSPKLNTKREQIEQAIAAEMIKRDLRNDDKALSVESHFHPQYIHNYVNDARLIRKAPWR